MLRMGLTGGIGAGKSEVARRLVGHGAVVIDADQLAREVVAPGTDGLREVTEVFGPDVLDGHGALDRDALAAAVFADDTARQRLEAIVHPRVRARSEERTAAAPADAVVVQDVPLLVEVGLAPTYHLVVVVTAAEETRVGRLSAARGMPAEQARDRIRAQLDDETRRAAADVVLTNDADLSTLHAAVDALWRDRLVGYEAHVRAGRAARYGAQVRLVCDHARWAAEYARLAARIRRALGDVSIDHVSIDDLSIDHVGSTAVPGLPAKDVVDVQVTVPDLATADALAAPLADAGFPRLSEDGRDHPHPVAGSCGDTLGWAARVHGSADPGRVTTLYLRRADSPERRRSLLLRDWLRADSAARDEYARHKRALARERPDVGEYAGAMAPWWDAAAQRAEQWARETGWRPGAGAPS